MTKANQVQTVLTAQEMALQTKKEEMAKMTKQDPAIQDVLNKEHGGKDFKMTDYRAYIEEKKDERIDMLSQFNITVLDMHINDDRGGRAIGWVSFRLPAGYATISAWNNQERKMEHVEMANFKLDALEKADTPFNLREGNGEIRVPIMRGRQNKEHYVKMPQNKSKDGRLFGRIKTRDNRTKFFHEKNNLTLEAVIGAYVRLLMETYEESNPVNHKTIDRSCETCRWKIDIRRHDGMEQDAKGMYSAPGVIDSAENGQEAPRMYCPVYNFFPDEEAVKVKNDNDALDKSNVEVTSYTKAGEQYTRNLRHDEVAIGGKPVKRENVTKLFTSEVALECGNYLKHERKDENRVQMERSKTREETGISNAVSPAVEQYYSEYPTAERMRVQTQIEPVEGKVRWVNQYPGEVEEPIDVRVMGPGGLLVTGTDVVLNKASTIVDFVAKVQKADTRENEILRKIEHFIFSSYRIDVLTEEQLDILADRMMDKPKVISDHLSARWDKAVDRYIAALQAHLG